MSVDAAIKRLEEVKRLATDGADELTEAVGDELKRTAAAGTDPNGVPWEKTQTGEVPLKDAAIVIRTIGRVLGDRVVIVAKIMVKRYVLHHLGIANGAPRRQILPDGTHPPVHTAIRNVLKRRFGGG